MRIKKSPKILLIGCPWIITKKSLDYLNAPVLIGLGYIAAVLEKNNYSVKILDTLAEGFNRRKQLKNKALIRVGLSEKQIIKCLKEHQPDVVGISNPFTSQSYSMFRMARLVKRIEPKTIVIVGGVHPSSDPVQCIKDKNIDFAITGEGEYALLNLIKALQNSDNLNNVKGLFYKKNNKIYSTGTPQFIENLDEIPFPAYHLLPMKSYLEIARLDSSGRNINKEKYISVISSRGCPFNCIFCGANLLVGKKWRFRSPKNFVDEIEFLQKKYRINNFTFEDSNFSLDQQRAEQICDEIINRKLNINWSLPNGIRADRVTDELISKIKKAGCKSINLGIEHGNQEYLNNFVKKNLHLKNVERTVKIIRKYKIPLGGFFIMGFPEEPKSLIRNTISFALKLARKGMMPLFSIIIPLPGTELMTYCKKNNLLIKKNLFSIDYLLSSHSKPTVINKNLSTQELIRLRRRARILSLLNMMIFSPGAFFRYPFVKETIKSFTNPTLLINRFKLLLTKLNIGT